MSPIIHSGWLYRDWWAYLLAPSKSYISRLGVIWCRMHGHPAGVWWFSSGTEPDMRCKNCGDDLG